VAFVGSPNDAAERLLRVSAPPGAIAAPHFRVTTAGSPRLVHLSFQIIDLLAQPILLSLEAIMRALRLVALALGAFRPFSQVFDLTSGPIVQGRVA
jgi:hypothetical protein